MDCLQFNNVISGSGDSKTFYRQDIRHYLVRCLLSPKHDKEYRFLAKIDEFMNFTGINEIKVTFA